MTASLDKFNNEPCYVEGIVGKISGEEPENIEIKNCSYIGNMSGGTARGTKSGLPTVNFPSTTTPTSKQ